MDKLGKLEKGVVITADDYGLSPGVNDAISRLVAKGKIQAVSVLVFLVDSITHEMGNVDIGLHLNLTFAPGLNDQGHFIPRATFKRKLTGTEYRSMQEELLAQLDRFVELFKTPPVHLSFHHGIHRNLQVLDAAIEIAIKTRSFIRVYEPYMVERVQKFNIRHLDLSIMHEPFDNISDLDHLSNLRSSFRALQKGTFELVCHPGFVDEKLRERSNLISGRPLEYQLLACGKIESMLEEIGIEIVRFPC